MVVSREVIDPCRPQNKVDPGKMVGKRLNKKHGPNPTPTHLVDGHGVAGPGEDLECAPPGPVKQLHHPWGVLVLLLRVAEPPIAPKTPSKDPFLGVECDLN